ncbi:hypothetical protein PV08_09578 [Exophiala spinifera]|uniref:Uncharacterized protein n=1 Tax=Exophiala spinifera TaxID=91928 RepID=A0A0D1YBI7_9EURO|nr:uncharacterized protein PV08_09578 [Exophiala spinifera]KIW12301.1 hypothetical protein PV08_09578 [Exophiala spinifera]
MPSSVYTFNDSQMPLKEAKTARITTDPDTSLSDRPNNYTALPTSRLSRDGDDKPPIYATTFGIELEFCLAFREELLRTILQEYHTEADIVKTFTAHQHDNLLGKLATNPIPNPALEKRWQYSSWALHVPQNDPGCQKSLHREMYANLMTGDKQYLRRYVMEPLLMAQKCLNTACLDSNVVGWVEPDRDYPADPSKAEIPFPGADKDVLVRSAVADYSKWTLTNDYTLVGALKSQLGNTLQKRNIPTQQISNWDSTGVELITPIFEFRNKESAFQEIEQYLGALSSPDIFMMDSVWASTHVHVGFNFDKPADMPILLLQHLAYILVLHEDLLSKCHPRSRCGVELPESVPEEPSCDPLDDYFDPDTPLPPEPTEDEQEKEHEDAVLAWEAQYTGAGNVDSNYWYLHDKLLAQAPTDQHPSIIRDCIFKEHGNVLDLVENLQRPIPDKPGTVHRGYMYNFANLVVMENNTTSWKPIKPTVEFRQHACTTDIGVIQHWVDLLEAIVRKAEESAATTTNHSREATNTTRTFAERAASKYSRTCTTSWPYTNMKDFCVDFLNLHEDEGEYWQTRYDQYKDDRPSRTVSR